MRLFSCRAKGAFRHEDEKVTVGDEVVLRYDESAPEETAVIREILPRKNILIRPPLANLDILFSVIAAARPAPTVCAAVCARQKGSWWRSMMPPAPL